MNMGMQVILDSLFAPGFNPYVERAEGRVQELDYVNQGIKICSKKEVEMILPTDAGVFNAEYWNKNNKL